MGKNDIVIELVNIDGEAEKVVLKEETSLEVSEDQVLYILRHEGREYWLNDPKSC